MPSPARGLSQPERVELSSRRLTLAAIELIVEKGWEATTAAEIGRRAGYSRAMVHARYGSKDAILDTFLHEYVTRLTPELDPRASGLEQVVAHIDRLVELYLDDPELLRAMFVATFEAVKTTSPLRERTQTQLLGGAEKVGKGLRKGVRDGSVRSGIDLKRAAGDITTSGFGVAFFWIVLPDRYDLARELTDLRVRIIRDYGTTG